MPVVAIRFANHREAGMPPSWTKSTWFRLTFRFSSSIQTWHERVGDCIGLAGIAMAVALSLALKPAWWIGVLLWAVCLAPAVILSRAGWLKVCGPVLFYDMVRQGRRGRFILLRFLYAMLLVFLLACVVLPHAGILGFVSNDEASQVAQEYFEVLMVAQFATVVLLTPAYVGGTIAEEKDRKTLEFMLATDLLNREIVLGKLGSRLGNLGLVVLTGLPLLSFLQFLGGIEPILVVAGFLVTAFTILGLAGITILFSTTCRKSREAIMLGYLVYLLYYLLILLFWLSLTNFGYSLLAMANNDWYLVDLFNIVEAGDLVGLLIRAKIAGASGTMAGALPALVGKYAAFQSVVALITIGLSIARLRRSGLADSSRSAPRVGGRWLGARAKPAVGHFPMLWKEVYCDGTRGWVARSILLILLVCLSFAPAAIISWYHLIESPYEFSVYNSFPQKMHAWAATVTGAVGFLTILAVSVRAAGTMTGEREKQTWDTLLTTPVDSSAILYGKWLGSILGVRWGMVWLAGIWAVALVTGGIHPLALPVVMLAWFVYAAFFAVLGLWYSTVCKTSLRAMVLTVFSVLTLCGGHWIMWMCCVFAARSGPGEAFEILAQAQLGVMTPPFVMGFAAFHEEMLQGSTVRDDEILVRLAAFSLVGLVVWTGACAVLYAITSIRLRILTHRGPGVVAARLEWDRRQRGSLRPMVGTTRSSPDDGDDGETPLPADFDLRRPIRPPDGS
jgi:ABC-type transport system involved in multi-copper enzyme maturation permease subunit